MFQRLFSELTLQCYFINPQCLYEMRNSYSHYYNEELRPRKFVPLPKDIQLSSGRVRIPIQAV